MQNDGMEIKACIVCAGAYEVTDIFDLLVAYRIKTLNFAHQLVLNIKNYLK
ncbi:MAG: hypothetical protein ACOC11_01890 [Prolixibacteraceae bacterium]